jgi:ABC-type uncharacterized transport system fused permease/ATPase subunit
LLVVAALGETAAVALTGSIAGSFYQALLDRDPAAFRAATLSSLALYALVTAVVTAHAAFTEFLALRWRRRLTGVLHAAYFRGAAFHALAKSSSGVDNPDQRIQRDAERFCTALAQTLRVYMAAPFAAAYYTWSVHGYVGWGGVGMVYAFVTVGVLFQLVAARRLPKVVRRQERLEGDFRVAHMRVRACSEGIVVAGGGRRERATADAAAGRALGNQWTLLLHHAVLQLCTSFVDYFALAVNYATFVTPIFYGGWNGVPQSEIAQRISNSSFGSLMLLNTFTQMLDQSRTAADALAYAVRVGTLLEKSRDLESLVEGEEVPATKGATVATGVPRAPGDGGAGGGSEVNPAEGQPRLQFLVSPPVQRCFRGEPLQFSVHSFPQDMAADLGAVFPGLPPAARPENVLAVPTFQFYQERSVDRRSPAVAAPDGGGGGGSGAEMDRLLANFEALAEKVRHDLEGEGHWCDAVDPLTGAAMFGRRGQTYSEVRGAAFFLGYGVAAPPGECPVVRHPRGGSCTYPASLFSTAPADRLLRALRAACDPLRSPSDGALHRSRDIEEGDDLAAPVRVADLTVHDPMGHVVVRGLSLEVQRGKSLLLRGPSGSGKTTLVRTLCGLWPSSQGTFGIAPGNSSMVLLQSPLLAGAAAGLRDQIVYPEEEVPGAAPSDLLDILGKVGLEHLLERAGGDWERPLDWEGGLTRGEQQRLALARVLFHRPAVVVLDEATASVDAAAEAQIYGHLRECCATVISAGHSAALAALHDSTLDLLQDGLGGWELSLGS